MEREHVHDCIRPLNLNPEESLAVRWVTEYEGIGNSYGYAMHNARSREALAEAGVAIRPDADVAFHVAPAHLFEPIPGKINVLYMAWETDVLPSGYVEKMIHADAVIVTASFLVPVVRKVFPNKPVYLCHEGVDIERFAFRRRSKPMGKPFRFLWVGAPNARKGWELVLQAWRPFEDNANVELYIKTTLTQRLERYRNVTFDSRNLPAADLVALYHSANAFLFPSFGEGFGLTMAEAMATGLPVAYTPWSSLNDLANASCGYPLRFRLVPAWATPSGGLSTEAMSQDDKAVRTHVAQAEAGHLAETMVSMLRHYSRAVRKGVRAAQRIRNQFTWTRTGQRLAAILKEVLRECQPV